MNFENENTEYKSVIAFANTNGGIIYVGYDDDGNAVGIDDVDNVYTKITNTVRDSISPDITMFTKYTLQDNNTILIEVSEGTAKPYYIKSKGIKPSGVYVRQGASSVQASQEQIQMMIKLSDDFHLLPRLPTGTSKSGRRDCVGSRLLGKEKGERLDCNGQVFPNNGQTMDRRQF